MPSRYATKTNRRKTNRRKTNRKMRVARGVSGVRNKSYVYITGTRIGHDDINGRVAQVIKSNGNKYAVIVNYNGKIVILDGEYLRVATDKEKRADKKEKTWNTGLTDYDKKMLYPERQRNKRSRRSSGNNSI